jgi:hypothetical protein
MSDQTRPGGSLAVVVARPSTDVIAPPPGDLFSETNDNSVAILLTYGTAYVLLAGEAEFRDEEYPTRGLEWSSTFRNYTHSPERRFRALLLTEGGAKMLFHRETSDR